jgi:threonine dehydratase
MSSLDFSDILQARQHLHGIVRQTPFERSAALSDQTNMEVYLKAECLQRTGSFKLRGAYHKIASLSSEEKEEGTLVKY